MDGAVQPEPRTQPMSNVEHLTSELKIDDPFITRVLTKAISPESDFKTLGSTGTSCSIIAVDDISNVLCQLEVEGSSLMDRIRCEIVLMTDADPRSARSSAGGRGRPMVRPRCFGKPDGGRASVLSEAVDRCANEFVIMAGSGAAPLSGLPDLLGHMWTEGADIAVLSNSGIIGERDQDGDTAALVPAWMGLATGDSVAAQVRGDETLVMRRWLARWVFNEIERAIDPAVEIADRVRLLGVTIVVVPTGN